MKRILLAFLILTIILGGGALVFFTKPLIFRTFLGGGRVLFPPINAEVRIDGELQPNFRCFRTRPYSLHGSAEMLVLYETTPNGHGYNDAIIVDVTEKAAGLPNAGSSNYFIFANYLLFQSESGAAWVPFNSAKFDGFDPKYIFDERYIRFDEPFESKTRTFEIKLNE